jgi:CRISPR-associated protein Cmr1
MPRGIGPCPDAPEKADPWGGYARESFSIQVVTPMFGGGAEPGEPDPVTLIRAPSIRGHLRFWWRATCGASCENVEKMRQREAEIWGDTENPSKVIITTTVISPGERKACAQLPHGKSSSKFEKDHPGYALFPFQGNARKNEPIGKGMYGVAFRVQLIDPPDSTKEIKAALWAWLNFGGIGARTRRGCGTLYCKDFAPPNASPKAIQKWLADWWSELTLSDSPSQREWPVLPPCVFVSMNPSDNPLAAWDNGVDTLRRFRQAEGVGRNPGQGNRPGRSRWPEPESVRRATNQRARTHQRMSYIPDTCYPRAEFGLPIIFHFKDKREPPDTSLEPAGGTGRFSSPLILRPLCCADGKCLPMIVRLCAPLPDKVLLKPVGGGDPIEIGVVRNASLSQYRDSPMSGRTQSGSAIEAFLAFAEAQGYKEVAL